MHCPAGIFHIFIMGVILVLEVCECSKYSKESNLKNEDDLDFQNQEKPFKMQKVNLLWSKGRKILPESKLADLYADLKIHDKHETHLKKMRSQDLDTDGAMEAKVLTNYKRIVDYYGFDELGSPSGTYMSNEIPVTDENKEKIYFPDPKLQDMWKRAVQAGFSERDLSVLREEFWHQQMKIDEYNFIHRQMGNVADPDDNSVELEHEKQNVPPTDAKDKKAAWKKDMKDIKDGYMNLEHLVTSIPASEPTFKDTRVHKLWALAKKTNWTEDELNGFRDELLHFEHRLAKQTYYKQQLEQSADALGDLEEDGEIPDKHKHLEEKNRNLDQKIQKIHKDFKTRLDKALQHSEL